MSKSIWTDEEIERAVDAWRFTADLGSSSEWMRAALDAVPAVPLREYEALFDELKSTGDWAIECLRAVIAHKPVRGLDEALTGWEHAASRARSGSTAGRALSVIVTEEMVARHADHLFLVEDMDEEERFQALETSRRALEAALNVGGNTVDEK